MQIEACPPIAKSPGPGFQIVTGTFHHQAAKTLDIAVEGESKPIGTTPNHPFWSVDREAFVRADSLTVGERLQNLNGITTVKSISPRGPPEPVYNLEVQVKHTYYVADSGVLVHNGGDCSLPPLGGSYADAFDGPVRSRTFKKGDTIYRSPQLDELTNKPGSWFSTRASKTKLGTDSLNNIKIWGNPLKSLRTYKFTEDVTVYYGKVAGGNGYQLLFPRGVSPEEYLKFISEISLK